MQKSWTRPARVPRRYGGASHLIGKFMPRGRGVLATLMVALASSWFAGAAQAHPHIWIKAKATLNFENGEIVSVTHEWVFDDFFSNALATDFDRNKNKKFDADEIELLRKEAFVSLNDFGYFTHLRVAGKAVPVTIAKNFSAELDKQGRVIYRFVAMLPEPVDPRAQAFDASVHDHTFYVDLDLNPADGMKLAGPGAEACRPATAEDKDSPLFMGVAFARRFAIRCDKG